MRDFYRALEHKKIRRMLTNMHSSTIFVDLEKGKKMVEVTFFILYNSLVAILLNCLTAFLLY